MIFQYLVCQRIISRAHIQAAIALRKHARETRVIFELKIVDFILIVDLVYILNTKKHFTHLHAAENGFSSNIELITTRFLYLKKAHIKFLKQSRLGEM